MKSTSLLAAVGALVVGAFALSACSGGAAASQTPQDPKAPILVWVDDTRTKPAEAWAKAHPDIDAKIVSVDNTHGNISSQIALAKKAGKGVPDVVFLSYPDEIANLIANPVNYPASLEGVVDQKTLDGFAKGSMAGCTFGGKIYCLPNDLAQTVLYYNKALFDQWGLTVPMTFEQWAALGAKVAAEHPGYSLGSVNSRYGLNAYYGSSECKFNQSSDPTTVTIDTSATDCTRVNSVMGPLLKNGTLSTLDPFDPVFTELVKSGKLVATISPSWMGPYGIKPNATAEGQWAVAPMPTWSGADKNYSGAVGGGIWLVSATSKNTKAASAFAVGMTTDDAVQATAPTYPAYVAAADKWLEATSADKWYASDPAAVLKEAAAKISPTLGFVRYEVQLEDSFNATIVKNGATDIDAALKDFGVQATAAAKSAGYTVKSN